MARMKYVIIFTLAIIACPGDSAQIRTLWRIPFGQRNNEIGKIDDLVVYDFELYDNTLLLCDISQKKIKQFDNVGKLVSVIELPDSPEIIKTWNNSLIILLRDAKLGIYDFKKRKLSTLELNRDIKTWDYASAFFFDSLLYIPKSEQFVWLKSDAYEIDISQLSELRLSVRKGFYNRETKLNFPSDTLEIGKSQFFRQDDICYFSRDAWIIDKYDAHDLYSEEAFYIYDKSAQRLSCLFKNDSSQQGRQLLRGMGRGFKIYRNEIYFSQTELANLDKEGLVISKIECPGK